jgi:hypothetical protein
VEPQIAVDVMNSATGDGAFARSAIAQYQRHHECAIVPMDDLRFLTVHRSARAR